MLEWRICADHWYFDLVLPGFTCKNKFLNDPQDREHSSYCYQISKSATKVSNNNIGSAALLSTFEKWTLFFLSFVKIFFHRHLWGVIIEKRLHWPINGISANLKKGFFRIAFSLLNFLWCTLVIRFLYLLFMANFYVFTYMNGVSSYFDQFTPGD